MADTTQTPFISRIYNSRKVLLEQLEERGFDVSNFNNFSINDIHTMKEAADLDIYLTKELDDETKQRVYVKYHLGKRINPNYISDYVDDLFNIEEKLSKKDQLILIIGENINDTMKKTLIEYFNEGYFMTMFNLDDLSYNILDHTLVPTHTIMNNDEKETIKQKYNVINDTQFPEISRFDPVAKVIGLRPGELCEISRKSRTAIVSKYYRLCN